MVNTCNLLFTEYDIRSIAIPEFSLVRICAGNQQEGDRKQD